MFKKIRGQDAEKKGIMENHADEKLQAKKSDITECDKVLYKKSSNCEDTETSLCTTLDTLTSIKNAAVASALLGMGAASMPPVLPGAASPCSITVAIICGTSTSERLSPCADDDPTSVTTHF